MSVQVQIEHFTDPACPFAFSAEPVRWALRWHYGDQLQWRDRMIVLTREPGEAAKLAQGAPNLQRRFRMPIDPAPYPRESSSEPACRAVVAARIFAPERQPRLLRALRIRRMTGALLDDPELIAAAAADAGIEPDRLTAWMGDAGTQEELEGDAAAARDPLPAALALRHKLGGRAGEPRYTAPSYVLTRPDTGQTAVVPGFNPREAYETAVANLAPELERRRPPASAAAVLGWAGEPLATAEVAALLAVELESARTELDRVADPIASGAEFYWRLVAS